MICLPLEFGVFYMHVSSVMLTEVSHCIITVRGCFMKAENKIFSTVKQTKIINLFRVTRKSTHRNGYEGFVLKC